MKAQNKVFSFITKNIVYMFFVILIIVFSIASSDFFTVNNLSNLIRQYTPYTLLSLGLLVVIITGGIDLSVGSIVALTNVVCGMLLMKTGWSTGPAILVSLTVGIVSGAISGFLVSYRKMAPFIVTLAMMSIVKSLSFVLTNALVIKYDDAWIKSLGTGSFLTYFPNQLLILIPVIVIMWLILNRTSYGRLIYAIGSNEDAVILSGINNKLIKFSVYVLCGFLAAVSAILTLARLNVASAQLGQGYELDAIAGCVIGGAVLSGGKGTVMKTFVGVFVLAMIGNIMNLLAIPSYPQAAIKGAIIILAVLFQDNQKDQ